jgi:mannose-6-phosphate isomerase-like protein (cupin superfamily)
MNIKITDISTAIKVPINFDAYKMYSSEYFEIINIQFKPGEILEKHDNQFDVIFYVLEGKGVFELENEEVEIGNNSCFEVKAGFQRGWRNTSQEILKILVIKKL